MPGGYSNIKPIDAKPFVRGDNRINKYGRPKKMNLEKYLRKVLLEKVNDEVAILKILTKLRDEAIKGNMRATELLLDRAFGRVTQAIQPPNQSATSILAIQYILPSNGNNNQADPEAARSLGGTQNP